MISRLMLLLLLVLGGCERFPKDVNGTLERIEAEKSFSVGIVAGSSLKEPAAALIAGIEKETGATPRFETGAAEPLLGRLEAGDLDLVIGSFVSTTRWAQDVTLSPPLAIEPSKAGEIHLSAAMRNGENAWISLVERQARDVWKPNP